MSAVPSNAVSVELEVPFHDVDALRVVWHGHYYKYFEIARTQLFRARGLDQDAFVALGLTVVVIDTQCRHASPLRYADRFRVDAWFRDIEHRMCVAYQIQNLTSGRRAARGRTVLVTIDSTGGMLLQTPEVIRARLA